MPTATLTIDLDKSCKRCGQRGATKAGYCLDCITKMVKEGAFDKLWRDAGIERKRGKP